MSDLEELRKENDRLKQELDAIELAKAKKEQETLKAALEEKKRFDLEEHDKALIAKVKAELGIGVQSKVPEPGKQESINLAGKKDPMELFREDHVKRMQAAGKTEYKGRDYLTLANEVRNRRVV